MLHAPAREAEVAGQRSGSASCRAKICGVIRSPPVTSPFTWTVLSEFPLSFVTARNTFSSHNMALFYMSVLYSFLLLNSPSPFIRHGVPVGYVAILLALVASMGGFIFGYDTGQISDILLMDDFLVRFGTCSTPGVASTCHFSTTRAGLIVSLLSIGTLFGALLGAPYVDISV